MKKQILLIATIIAFSCSIKAQTTEQIVANFKTLVEEIIPLLEKSSLLFEAYI